MLEALAQSFGAVLVLVIIAGVGFVTSKRGWYSNEGRALIVRLVNVSIPCFLFYSITSKFNHDELFEMLRLVGLPFITIGVSFLISLVFIKMGLVRKEVQGLFIASFSSSTVLFIGIPVILALYGEKFVPFLLVYFFANCLFIWSVGLYSIKVDGVRRQGRPAPKFFSTESIRMLLTPPLVTVAIAIALVMLAVPLPDLVMKSAHFLGQMTTPLALIFVGITIQRLGFSAFARIPREIWLILLGCFVLRPIITYFAAIPFDLDPTVLKVFIIAAGLPITSVVAVISKNNGADEEFASSAIGITTVSLIFSLPVLLMVLTFI